MMSNLVPRQKSSYPPGHVPPRPTPQPRPISTPSPAPINVVTIGVAQECRCVFGLRDRMAVSPCSIGRDLSLAAMDAPDLMPAGSMTGVTYPGGPRLVMESNIKRGSVACITATNWENAA